MAKILLAEDDQYMRELYQQLLVDEGFTVDTASDGDICWQMIKKGGYDLALIDISMPKADGLTILKQLDMKPPPVPNKKLVMLTSYNQETYIKEAFAFGASGYLIKPSLTPVQFISEVKRFLSGDDTVVQKFNS